MISEEVLQRSTELSLFARNSLCVMQKQVKALNINSFFVPVSRGTLLPVLPNFRKFLRHWRLRNRWKMQRCGHFNEPPSSRKHLVSKRPVLDFHSCLINSVSKQLSSREKVFFLSIQQAGYSTRHQVNKRLLCENKSQFLPVEHILHLFALVFVHSGEK